MFASAVAGIVWLGVSAFTAAVIGAVDGSIGSVACAASLLVGLAAAVMAFRSTPERDAGGRPGAWDLGAFAALAVVSLRHFGFVLYERGGQYWTADVFNYGDLPLHWTYVANFARGARFWPENPIFTGARLQYPFGIDLLTALLVRLGLPLAGTLRLLGLACAALLLFWLWRWGRGFAVAAFLFSGGVGAWGQIGDVAKGPEWKNLFLALFVPQRGFLFALPAGLLLLWSWRERLLRGSRSLPAWVEGVVWGVMPLFHLHTFLFASVAFAVWTVASRRWRAAWAPLAWALLPGTWGVLEVTNGFRAASLIGWKPGWVMSEAHQGPLTFLIANFTLFLPLFFVAVVRAVRLRDTEGVGTLVLGLTLWASLFFVMLAPWDWDNTKVMLWCYVLMLPAAGRLVIEPLPRVARAAVVAALIAPGIAAVVDSLGPRNAYPVGHVAEVRGVCDAVMDLPVEARVATAQTFNHPVALCGQPLVAGYAGHLWSHGIQAGEVEARLKGLMLGEPGWEEAARSLSARYLFWGPREAADFAYSTRPWENTRRRVASGAWGSLYDLAAPLDGTAP